MTRELGLRYVASERPLHGMSDADWADCHSTMGYIFLMHSAAVSSTCEAEIVAASEAGKEAVYMGGLAGELNDGSPIDLFVDNKSAIDLAYKTRNITSAHEARQPAALLRARAG